MFHANMFHLVRSEELPVYVYEPIITPQPVNRPQAYQILGIVAKQIMYEERMPVVSTEGCIESLACLDLKLLEHTVEIPDVGKFSIILKTSKSTKVSLDQFENYKLLVNRMADIALTVFSNEYYKFHPKAPYILRDEPYFDADFIERTGIMDSKRYYRGLAQFGGEAVFVVNRETQLRSNKNLLFEIKSLKRLFEETRDTSVDFYNPSSEFIDYVNYLLRGKSADVVRGCYPGPSVKKIRGISWRYRAQDKIPGFKESPVEYIQKTYGISGLDPQQPLVVYEIENLGKTQYHIPEVLSIGHTFEDLYKRVPSWQRSQIWGTIHPDCKNQLHKIYDVLLEIDHTLRKNIPEVYPKLLEISTESMNVSSSVSQAIPLELLFENKTTKVKPPYDIEFYHNYSNKKVTFLKPIKSPRIIVCAQNINQKIKRFLEAIAVEFKLRNNSELSFDFGALDPDENNFDGYQMVLTIGDETEESEERYVQYKKHVQNELGIVHQHVTTSKADKNSVMQVVMQMCLKMGGDPWLLPNPKNIPVVIGVDSYLNPKTQTGEILVIVFNGNGSFVKQFPPVERSRFDDVIKSLIELNKIHRRVLYLVSFDRFDILNKLKTALEREEDDIEYCISEISDQESLRFFETWVPKKAPRFGKTAAEVSQCPIEAFENAPQGAVLKCDESTFFLLTGKTIEKDALKRGCPMPIEMKMKATKGEEWNTTELVNYILSLCMMGRASGHMTRFPMPLYYLKLYAYYVNRFGAPKNERIGQSIFYI